MNRIWLYLLAIAVTACFVVLFPYQGNHDVSRHLEDDHHYHHQQEKRQNREEDEKQITQAPPRRRPTSAAAPTIHPADDDDHHSDHHHDLHNRDDENENQHEPFASKLHPTSRFNRSLATKLQQPLLDQKALRLLSGSVMPLFRPPQQLEDLAKKLERDARSYNNNDNQEQHQYEGGENDHEGDRPFADAFLNRPPIPGEDQSSRKCAEWPEKDSPSNVAFALEFSRILRDRFPPSKGGALDGSGLHWFLDEGGLIGTSRAGALRNADDDFDFFLLLPRLHAPCRADSLTCTAAEFNRVIHDFLMIFHNEGMCINKFSPNLEKFKSRGRLMYSFQLNRGHGVDPERCFQENKPFAHMHLGIFNERGEVCTNIWIPPHSTHIKDKLHLDDMLPVTRCRAGPVDVPCPQNITGFLTVRNGGEYRKRSADGSCLIVKKKWGLARKKAQAQRLRELDTCGYNSIVDLLPEFIKSNFKTC